MHYGTILLKTTTATPVLAAKGIASGKKAVKISWNNVGADRYVIYMVKCNKRGKAIGKEQAKIVNVKKSKKLLKHTKKLRFTSSNSNIATVTAGGKVTAKAKGTCKIYVQTVNGIWKTCKVTVT